MSLERPPQSDCRRLTHVISDGESALFVDQVGTAAMTLYLPDELEHPMLTITGMERVRLQQDYLDR